MPQDTLAVVERWFDEHMPAPLHEIAKLASRNCLEYEQFMPIGFLIYERDGRAHMEMVPVPQGFATDDHKDQFVEMMRSKAATLNAIVSFFITEAWTVLQTLRPRGDPLDISPPSEHPYRVEILMFNWEHFDQSGKIITDIAVFRIIRQGDKPNGVKIGLELLQYLRDQNGGRERLEGKMAHVLVPKELAV